MKIRVIAGLSLAPLLFVVVLALPEIWTAVAVSAVCAIAAYEMLWRTGLVKTRSLVLCSAIFAAAVPFWCCFGTPYLWGALGFLVLFAVLFTHLLFSNGKIPFREVAFSFVAAAIIPFMLSALVRIQYATNGRYMIMAPFCMAFLSDIGAYFIGKFFGKHQMAPVISPKKTVEGLIGGVITDILGMILYAWILQLCCGVQVNYLAAAVYGLVGAFAAVFGDLCFSVIKRQTGIKDYGNLIPGHGGALDRFDSVVVVAPLAELLFLVLPLVV